MHKIDLRRIDLNLLVVFDVLMTERSVTHAAARLGRTQSAVSHALARLREQLDDPLLVKSGGRMGASPFAEYLMKEVRPILANIQRVLAPPQEFKPATTTREFRIALPDVNHSFFPLLAARVQREAPNASVEWVPRDAQVFRALTDGHVDIALSSTTGNLPEGIAQAPVRPFKWASFMRRGHPAANAWGRDAWLEWPHVAVRVDAQVPSPIEGVVTRLESRRRITAWVPTFAAVAPLLARTDLIATLPAIAMADWLEPFGLRALKAPIPIEPMPHRLVWSHRLANDPANRWFRAHVVEAFEAVMKTVEGVVGR